MNVSRGFVDEQKHLPHDEQLSLVQKACKASYVHDFIESLPMVNMRLIFCSCRYCEQCLNILVGV